MKKTMLILSLLLLSSQITAAEKDKTDGEGPETQCHIKFKLSSWSVFYKQGKGQGAIICDNGQTAAVKIKTHGGGVTFGKSKIKAHGTFTKVHDISELFGSYAETDAHAGASSSAGAHAVWNGNIGLSLAGSGKGWDLGFNFGSFKISRK